MNIGPKGIKRGHCKGEDCEECDSYIYNPKEGARCEYCNCPPTKHIRIDEMQEKSAIREKSPNQVVSSSQEEKFESIQDKNFEEPLDAINSQVPIFEFDCNGRLIPISPSFFKSSTILLPPSPKQSTSKVDSNLEASLLFENIMFTPEMNSSTLRKPALVTARFPHEKESNGANIHHQASVSQQSTSIKKITSANIPQLDSVSQSNTHTRRFDEIVSRLSRSELYEFCVPSRLPDDTEQRIKRQGFMTSHERQFILRWILWTMCNLEVTSEKDFVEVATLALGRFPLLQSSLNKGVKGIVKSLKEIRRNHTYYEARKEKNRSDNSNSSTSKSIKDIERIKSQIHKEMDTPNPSIVTLKGLLQLCRKERSNIARKENCETHLTNFPCLRMEDIIFWEFIQQEQLQCSRDDLKMRWLNALPKMVQYFSSSQKIISHTLPPEQASAEVLSSMTSAAFFGPRKPQDKRDRNSFILEIFNEKTLLQKTLPEIDDPPRLIAIGDGKKSDLQAHIYVDRKAVYSGPIVDALTQIVALYYVLHIAPSPDARASFSFIFGILMQEAAEKEYKRYKSVLKALESIKRP